MGRARVDRDRAHRLYRLGQLTDVEIAAAVGCRPTTIKSYARKYGWVRDLSTQVAEQTRAELSRGSHGATSDDDAVNEAATAAVTVVRKHRAHIEQARALIEQMFEEMGAVNVAPQVIADVLETGLAAQKMPIEAIRNIVGAYSLGSRAKSMNSLATALARLIQAERVAWNLDEDKAEKPFEKALRDLDSLPDDGAQEA